MILCPPAVANVVVSVASPAPLIVPVPIFVAPSKKVTIPSVDVPVTVDVNVTFVLTQTGLLSGVGVDICASRLVYANENNMIAKNATALLGINFLISLERTEKMGIVISIVAQFFQVAGILIRFRKSFGSMLIFLR